MSVEVIQKKEDYTVASGKTRAGKNVVYRKGQSNIFLSKKQIITNIMTPAPTTTSLTNGTQFSFIISPHSFRILKTATLRFQITLSAATANLAPTPDWFDRIEIINRSTNQELARVYGDSIKINLARLDQYKLELMSNEINTSDNGSWYNQTAQAASSTRYYYLPLVYTLFHDSNIDFGMLNHEVELRFFPRSGVVVSGSGVASLMEVALIVETEVPDSASEVAQRNLLSKNIVNFNFLGSQVYNKPAQAYVASTTYSTDLDVFKHKSAFLAFMMRSTNTTVASNANARYQNLDGALVDILEQSGKSVFGGGRGIGCDYIRNIIMPKYFPSKFFQDNYIYCIPFGSISKAYDGQMDRFFHMDGSRKQIQLQLGAAGTSETQTVTISAAGASGAYRLGWKGALTASLAFGTTTANMAVAMNALPTVLADNLSFSFSATLAAGTSTVATITQRNGQYFENNDGTKIDVITENLISVVPAAITVTSVARTTTGKLGFTAGTYILDLYSFYYSCLSQDGGSLTAFQY